MTLTDFLLARIAEDEYDAKPFVNDLGEARRWRADGVGGTVRRVGSAPFGLPDVEATTATHMEAAHIARHDPARVLAECEAKRRIVDRIDLALTTAPPSTAYHLRAALHAMAAVYAAHPDYRQEWPTSASAPSDDG